MKVSRGSLQKIREQISLEKHEPNQAKEILDEKPHGDLSTKILSIVIRDVCFK
jgi:hypothetical protein